MMAAAGGGPSSFDHRPDLQLPGQHSSLRARILRESTQHARQRVRRQRQPYFNEPNFPGTAAFNLHTGLGELPRSKRRKRQTVHQERAQVSTDDESPEIIEEAVSWTTEEHNDRMMQEFEALEQASKSNSPTILSISSDGNPDISSSSSLNQDQECTCAVPRPSGILTIDDRASYRLPEIRPTAYTVGTVHHQHSCALSRRLPTRAVQSPSPPDSSDLIQMSEDSSLRRRLTRATISEQELINEVKGIYAGLVMVEKKCVEVVNLQSYTTNRLENHQWKALVALHRTLLQEHHDFFSASQHPTASDALRKLAIKYAMPARMWRLGIRPVLDMFRTHKPHSDRSFASYVQLTHSVLNSLQMDFPEDAHEWRLVKYNLREYFLALKVDGVEIPSKFLDDWANTYSSTDWMLHEQCPPMTGCFFGDEESPDWFKTDYLAMEDLSLGSAGHPEYHQSIRLADTALCLMTGWLQYGRKIATSFHSFSHTFIVLGLVGAAMGLSD